MRRLLAVGLALAALAGCKPGDSGSSVTIFTSLVNDSALSAGYNGWTSIPTAIETAATALRNSATYQSQNFSFVGSSDQHFSLSNANVEYAHAAGLTGAGQIIAIIDEGFLTSHDALSGSAITTFGTVYSPSSSDACNTDPSTICHGSHGTAVASIAAGSDASANFVGVAPGAALYLSRYTFSDMTTAINAAAAAGAIVQNNSWGYEADANQSNYNSVFGGSAGQAYISALQNFAKTGVIVFAASNDTTRTKIDLVAGLPDLVSGLETSFITAVNIVPAFDLSGNVTSATLLSSACLGAARYCLAADGSVYSASIEANQAYVTDNYAYWSGTSFAAPQIAGAVALLAEAFPALTAQELRARLLASADNSFFTHTGAVQFSSTVTHGFNDVYGHGLLDLEAALLPIGGAYVPVSTGTQVTLGQPLVVSAGAAGPAIDERLATRTIAIADGLGDGFDVAANVVGTHAVPDVDPLATLDAALAVDGPSADTAFPAYLGGSRMAADIGTATTLAIMVPDQPDGSAGVSFESRLASGVMLGLSGVAEGDGFLGISVPGASGRNSLTSTQVAAHLGYQTAIAPGVTLGADYAFGQARARGSGAGIASFDTAAFDEVGLTLVTRGTRPGAGQLSARLSMPQAVVAGRADLTLPTSVTRSAGATFEDVPVPLSPSARQLDLSLNYDLPIARNRSIVLTGEYNHNLGHIAGLTATTLGIGWRAAF